MNNNLENLICTNCGESLNARDNFCSSCGASVIKPKEMDDSKKSIPNEKRNKKSLRGKGLENKNIGSNPDQKKISTVKIVYLAFFFVVIALVIVYSSGSFDKPGISAAAQSSENDVHKGVDLQYLQRINTLEEEFKINPDDSKLLELAHLLNDSGLKEKAIEKYQTYLKSNPKDADVLVDMGVCFFELGKNEEALRFMKDALKYQPKHQIAHLNLGIVSLSANLHDEAVDWWKKAVELDPSNSIGKRAQELINSH
jgi:tetratricopeptide (TPR) repeat protein